MIVVTIREITALSGGRWTGSEADLDKRPLNIVTDSRDAGEGCLFVAFRGERTDGHKYIPDVLKKGAMAVLCEEEGEPGEPRIVVEEVYAALRKIASVCRNAMEIPFVGVTGSVGKTTAKEMISAVLGEHFNTYKTPGSMNGQVGVPIALMGLGGETEAAVVEMGISLPGEMRKLAEVVHPEIGVFMNVADAHLEALQSRSGILREKADMLAFSPKSGTAVINGDDELLSAYDFGRKTVTFGLGGDCDVRAADQRSCDGGTAQRCRILSGDHDFEVYIPAYGTYMIYAALAAAAVGLTLGLSEAEITEGISHYATVGHRSRILRKNGLIIVDDCYNANPHSMRAALDSLTELPGRKICVFGDMRELGTDSAEMHREIGAYAAEKGVAALYAAGNDAPLMAEAAVEIGRVFPDKATLIATLPSLLQPGDTVLIKASHSCEFEDVVDALLKD